MNVTNSSTIEVVAQAATEAAGPVPSAVRSKEISAGPAAGTSLAADKTNLSEAASQIAGSTGDGDVRLDKVASIQAALHAGTYQVPASAVAQKLISSMLAIE